MRRVPTLYADRKRIADGRLHRVRGEERTLRVQPRTTALFGIQHVALQELRLPAVHTLWHSPNDPQAQAIRLRNLPVPSVCLRIPETNKHKVQSDKPPHVDMRQVSTRATYIERMERQRRPSVRGAWLSWHSLRPRQRPAIRS